MNKLDWLTPQDLYSIGLLTCKVYSEYILLFSYPRTVIKPPNAEVMEAVDVIRLEAEGDATDGTAASMAKTAAARAATTAVAASSETVTGKKY